MLKINLFNQELECQKACYLNGRLAIVLIDPESNELYTTLTVNIDAPIPGESGKEAFINHQYGENYKQLIQSIIDADLAEETPVMAGFSGFNEYLALRFKDAALEQMIECQ